MPNFLSILKTIGKDALAVEHIAVPVAEVLFPPAAPILSKLDNLAQGLQASIIKIEQAGPVYADSTVKAGAAVTDFEAGLAVTQSVLAMEGKKVTYDEPLLQAAIAAQVDAYNKFALLKASIKITSI